MIHYPIDLHLHSRCSDGLKTPGELCAAAGRLRLSAIALCDHDTTDGLAPMSEAVGRYNASQPDAPPMRFIPAIEVSAGVDGSLHLLGYGVNPHNPALQACLSAAQEDRQQRAEQMMQRLEAQGVSLKPETRAALSTAAAGRAHIARALVESGVVSTVKQAFERYLAQGKSAYVPRRLIPATEAVALLRAAGVTPVLAHPCRLKLENPALLALIGELMEAGLCGLEAYHPSASRTDAARLAAFARRSGLLVTGGSDFHGDRDTRVAMARMPSGWHDWEGDLQTLLRRMGQA